MKRVLGISALSWFFTAYLLAIATWAAFRDDDLPLLALGCAIAAVLGLVTSERK